jgi:hypothetical protein
VCPRALLSLALATTSHAAAAEPKLDNLIVYGKGFAFAAKEPPGWKANAENASRLAANIAFYRPGETIGSARQASRP